MSKGIIEPSEKGYIVKTDMKEVVAEVATFEEGLVLLQVTTPVITLPIEYSELLSWHKVQPKDYYFTPELTFSDCIKDCQGESLALTG